MPCKETSNQCQLHQVLSVSQPHFWRAEKIGFNDALKPVLSFELKCHPQIHVFENSVLSWWPFRKVVEPRGALLEGLSQWRWVQVFVAWPYGLFSLLLDRSCDVTSSFPFLPPHLPCHSELNCIPLNCKEKKQFTLFTLLFCQVFVTRQGVLQCDTRWRRKGRKPPFFSWSRESG